MSADQFPDDTKKVPAVGALLDPGVGRLGPERAGVGDAVAVDVRHPYPQTLRLVLDTQAAADKANELLALDPSAWRLERRVFPPLAAVNRYCRAGMCLTTDAEHESWCELDKKPNVRGKLPATAPQVAPERDC